MTENKCSYCNKCFANKYNLASHIKRAKFCLEIQRNLNLEVEEDFIVCEFCCLKCSPTVYGKHLSRCKVKKQAEIANCEESLRMRLKAKDVEINDLKNFILIQGRKYDELHSKLLKLEGQNDILKDDHESLKAIAKQAKITHNTTNNKILNMAPLGLTKDSIADVLSSKYTYKHGLLGQEGVAEFVKENLLTDADGNLKYVCTDNSRKAFKYKDAENNVCKDPKATELTKMIVDADIKGVSRNACRRWCLDEDGKVDKSRENYAFDKMIEVDKLAVDNTVFFNKLGNMTSI